MKPTTASRKFCVVQEGLRVDAGLPDGQPHAELIGDHLRHHDDDQGQRDVADDVDVRRRRTRASAGTGLTRIAARTMPRTNEPIADQNVSCTVIQNAPSTSYLRVGQEAEIHATPPLARSVMNRSGGASAGASAGRAVGGATRRRRTDSCGPRAVLGGRHGPSVRCSWPGRRWRRDGVSGRPDGVLQCLLPAAVGDHRLDRRVDRRRCRPRRPSSGRCRSSRRRTPCRRPSAHPGAGRRNRRG